MFQALAGQCAVHRKKPGVTGFVLSVCWLPVPAIGDRGRGPLVPPGLPYRDVGDLLAERSVAVDYVTVDRWVQRFTPESIAGTIPAEVTTDRAPAYPRVLDELSICRS